MFESNELCSVEVENKDQRLIRDGKDDAPAWQSELSFANPSTNLEAIAEENIFGIIPIQEL